jgi:hypothetical protein
MSIIIMDENSEVAKSTQFYFNKESYIAKDAKQMVDLLELHDDVEAIIIDCQQDTCEVLQEAKKKNISCYLYTAGPNDLLSQERNRYLNVHGLQEEYKETIKGVFLKPTGLSDLDQKIQKQKNKNPYIQDLIKRQQGAFDIIFASDGGLAGLFQQDDLDIRDFN